MRIEHSFVLLGKSKNDNPSLVRSIRTPTTCVSVLMKSVQHKVTAKLTGSVISENYRALLRFGSSEITEALVNDSTLSFL